MSSYSERVFNENFGNLTKTFLRVSVHTNFINHMNDIQFFKGICRDEPLTQSGKRIQLIKMLCLNVLPILGLWAYTVYTLADSIGFREEYYKVLLIVMSSQ